MRKTTLLYILLFTSISTLLAQPSEFDFTPNNISGGAIGTVQVNGIPASGLDYIAAFDEDNNCAGAVQLIEYYSQAFFNLQVYGNDNTTPDIDEGMDTGETFRFRLWVAATDEILENPVDIGPVVGWDAGLNGQTVPGYDFSDGVVLNFLTTAIDEDMDGFSGTDDPDDNDPCNPDDNVIVCDTDGDGIPNGSDPFPDCDGSPDECGVCNGSGIAAGTCDCAGTLPATWYADNDGDGLGDPNNSTESCEQPAGFVDNANDDNDTCSGVLDECGVCNGTGIAAGTCDCAGNLPVTWYADNDGDGFGDPNNSTESCDQPDGFVSNSNDADDTNPDASTDIPTLSQWGLILLSLILLSISTVSAMQKKYSLAYNVRASNSSATIPYFNKNLFKQMLMKSIPLMLFIFVLISFLEGGWFVRNLVGSILSIGVCVYVLHFIELSKQFDEGNH